MHRREDRAGTAAAIAARVLAVPVGTVGRPERIKGGLTNESWLVATDPPVVVRLSTTDEKVLGIDRASEAAVLAVMREAGIGPEVLYSSPAERVLVTRYLPGRVWTREDAAAPHNIRRLAQLLVRIHATPAPEGVAVIDLPGLLASYWQTLKMRGRVVPRGSWSREELLEAARILADSPLLRLCHNDVHHLNIVDAGELKLLDWEYAGIGDPAFDLASVCCYHSYSETARRQLLHDYLGRSDDSAFARLDLACRLFDCIQQLWLAVRAG